MIIGYIRVSTHKQNLDVQKQAIISYGIDKLYQEKASGRNRERPVLKELLDYIRSGDTLVIYDLSRLGRTVHQVIELMEYFTSASINFVSLKETIDTKTPIGRAMIGIIAAFNQMQVEIQNEKVKSGVSAARARGRVGGRKPLAKEKIKLINALYNQKYTLKEIATQVNVSRRSVSNYVSQKK